MKVIQPNCRVQFTAADIDFIVAHLGRKTGDAECVTRLLSDPESRDAILDDEGLFHALLEHRGCLGVSSHFYFYILVRRVLCRTGIDDRIVADYVAEILAEYSNIERTQCRVRGEEQPLNYFFEMLLALQRADDRQQHGDLDQPDEQPAGGRIAVLQQVAQPQGEHRRLHGRLEQRLLCLRKNVLDPVHCRKPTSPARSTRANRGVHAGSQSRSRAPSSR